STSTMPLMKLRIAADGGKSYGKSKCSEGVTTLSIEVNGARRRKH
ncbi:unnamed protein product, partial [Leptidea sinapis]